MMLYFIPIIKAKGGASSAPDSLLARRVKDPPAVLVGGNDLYEPGLVFGDWCCRWVGGGIPGVLSGGGVILEVSSDGERV